MRKTINKISCLIKAHLRKWLGIVDYAPEIAAVKKDVTAVERWATNRFHKIERAFDVGIDVSAGGKSRSWAIVCVRRHDKQPILRFVDMSYRNWKDIENFLEYFVPDKAERHIDAPAGSWFL